MKIYISHSTGYDFKNELYNPIRNSSLDKSHEITLPHENKIKLFDSHTYLKKCDLVIAEVSYPSTGQGIELGWANSLGVAIVCIYKKSYKPSSSIKAVSNKIFEYSNSKTLIKIISENIK